MSRPMSALAAALLLPLSPLSSTWADDAETQTLHNNVYQDSSSLPGGEFVTFQATQHTTTVITNVSCGYLVPAGMNTAIAFIGAINHPDAVFHVQPFVTGARDGLWYVAINAQVNLFVQKNDKPRVGVFLADGTPQELSCTVSGYHS